MKNHKNLGTITELSELVNILATKKSIYFVPAGRVLPTKFFMGYLWMTYALVKHFEAGNFIQVVPKSEIQQQRIKKAISQCHI